MNETDTIERPKGVRAVPVRIIDVVLNRSLHSLTRSVVESLVSISTVAQAVVRYILGSTFTFLVARLVYPNQFPVQLRCEAVLFIGRRRRCLPAPFLLILQRILN